MKATERKNLLSTSNIDALWAVVLRLKTFGFAELSVEGKISRDRAKVVIDEWVRVGAALHVSGGSGNSRKMFRVDPDFIFAPRGRTAPDNMWTAMRKLRSFTPIDIAAHSTTETVQVSRDQAAAYCQALLGAEYLAVTRKAAPLMKREAIYRLVQEHGPAAPEIIRVRAVRDPNSGRILMLGEGT